MGTPLEAADRAVWEGGFSEGCGPAAAPAAGGAAGGALPAPPHKSEFLENGYNVIYPESLETVDDGNSVMSAWNVARDDIIRDCLGYLSEPGQGRSLFYVSRGELRRTGVYSDGWAKLRATPPPLQNL